MAIKLSKLVITYKKIENIFPDSVGAHLNIALKEETTAQFPSYRVLFLYFSEVILKRKRKTKFHL